MFDGIEESRIQNMTDQEKRWLDNIKKAFYKSDIALQSGNPEDQCLEELFKAIDTAKTLRRSLRGEDISPRHHKERFIEFLGLSIPTAKPGESQYELREAKTGLPKKFTFGEIVYAIRCMIHENENLNAAEPVEYHILLDWSAQNLCVFARIKDGVFICNGFFLCNRLRQVLSKFITGLQASITFAQDASFSISCEPDIGSIRSERQRRQGN